METDNSLDTPVERLTRDDFIHEVFAPHYEVGQHVSIIGPTGSGKTRLAFELLDVVASPKLPAIILVMKPRDETVKEFGKLAGFKKTETWPPSTYRGVVNMQKSGGSGKKRRGFIFWPKQNLDDVEQDNKRLAREFKYVINDSLKSGNRILFADEVVGLSQELNLEKTLNGVWMRGRSMGCGLWAATQRPFHAPLLMYGSAEHLLLFKDPDKRSVDRFKEIGGVDPDIVVREVNGLKKFEFLYIGKSMGEDGISPALAVVGAK